MVFWLVSCSQPHPGGFFFPVLPAVDHLQRQIKIWFTIIGFLQTISYNFNIENRVDRPKYEAADPKASPTKMPAHDQVDLSPKPTEADRVGVEVLPHKPHKAESCTLRFAKDTRLHEASPCSELH